MYRKNLFAVLLPVVLASTPLQAAVIHGRITAEASTQPLAGARVSVVYRSGFFGALETGVVTTDSDGGYSIELPPDFVRSGIVVASAPGYAARNQAGEACTAPLRCYAGSTAIEVGSADLRADIALPREARISGRVVDSASGAALGHGSVRLEPVDGPAGSYSVETTIAADGSFSFGGVHVNSYRIWAQPSATASTPATHLNMYWPNHYCDDVQVACNTLSYGQLQILVAGQAPTPVQVSARAGARLRSRMVSSGNGQGVAHTAIASAAGSASFIAGNNLYGPKDYVELGPLLPGPVKLALMPLRSNAYPAVVYPDLPCSGFPCDVSAAPSITLAEGQLLITDDVTVPPLRTATGRVTDEASGQPLAGVLVMAGALQEPGAGSWGFAPAHSALTDADGRYYLEGINADALQVRTAHARAGYADQAWRYRPCVAENLFCHIGSDVMVMDKLDFVARPHHTGVDFALSRGAAIRGRLIHDDGSAATNFAIALLPLSVGRIGVPQRSDGNGVFRFEGLDDGAYYLVATPKPLFREPGEEYATIYPSLDCRISSPYTLPACNLNNAHVVHVDETGNVDDITFIVPRSDYLFDDGFQW